MAEFVCTVCFRTFGTRPSDCPRCQVPRSSVDDAEALEALREAAERRLLRASYASYFVVALFALAAAIAAKTLLRPFLRGGIFYALIVGFAALGLFGYRRLVPSSASAVLAERRRQIRAELNAPDGRQALPLGPAGAADPARLDARGLVRWLGARPAE